ncbi:MAG: restriction endonuclease subunit S [Spirochaetota bacterium]|jgi:type I restriction enzyme S subunit|nr:restriction endonuclease subunit S [Spirochaetota bacterium]
MNSWERLPIGELFSLEKGSLQSTKCTPGGYTFITASSEWKTHNEYSHDCEALVYAVAASGSLGRCHHYSGKFISSDLCFILRAKDEKKHPINYRFYQNVFRFLKDDIVAKTKAGTSKESISQKRFSAYTLPYIDIKHQSYWENKLNNLNDNIENFEVESTSQSSYITKLRQAILQEAIEGKLTADWRKENPVRKGDPDYDSEALLVKIQAEKEKLIKEGKIKKQKPLAPIKAEEVPFELPEGWVWTRLEDLGLFGRGKSKHRPRNDSSLFKDGKYPFVQTGEVAQSKKTGFKIYGAEKFYNDKGLAQSKLWPSGTLCITIAANIAETGFLTFDACFPDSVVGFTSLSGTYTPWYTRYFLSCAQDDLMKYAPATAQKNINLEIISKLVFPTPPLAEQQAIVDRVEKLLSMVDELEDQVSERKEQSEQLMQAVLREAFEGKPTISDNKTLEVNNA